jgi:hypothetical protein
MINHVKKCKISVFSIYISSIKIMYFIKKGGEKMRKMRIFESFFSQFDKITAIIKTFSMKKNVLLECINLLFLIYCNI